MSTQTNGQQNGQALGAANTYGFNSGLQGQQSYMPATLGGSGTQSMGQYLPTDDQAAAAQATYNVPSFANGGINTQNFGKTLAAMQNQIPQPTQPQARTSSGSPRLQAQNFSSGYLSLPQSSSGGNQALLALMQQLKA